MPTSGDTEYVDYVTELMQSVGPVTTKKMFGGYGFFLEGLMFGLMADSTLYLKADAETVQDFTNEGLAAFMYDKKGKEIAMSYYQAPDEALEGSDEMNIWANKAYGAALRAAAKKNKK